MGFLLKGLQGCQSGLNSVCGWNYSKLEEVAIGHSSSGLTYILLEVTCALSEHTVLLAALRLAHANDPFVRGSFHGEV